MGASGVCRAVIRSRRSGLRCPSIWKRTRCSPIGTRRHAVGVYPTGRSSTYTSANGSAFTLRHLDSWGVAPAGPSGAGAATVGDAGRAAAALTIGAGAIGAAAIGVVAVGAVAVGAGAFGIMAFGGAGRAGSISRLTPGGGAAARGRSGPLRRP